MQKHPHQKLSAVAIRNLTARGRYTDGNGLYLVADGTGAKRWVLRTVIHGKRTDMGLGSLRLVTLADARKKAIEFRGLARSGGDPLAARREAKRSTMSFKEAAEAVHDSHKHAWKNAKHRDQWMNTLTTYAFPMIGDRRVSIVDSADMLRVLTPIWLTKPETARRVKQRIGAVLDWAKAAGYRAGDNPTETVSRALAKQTDIAQHQRALPYVDLPAFVSALRSSPAGDCVRLAFEFLVLTATRTGEVIGAQWSEIDSEGKQWTIPAERMKANREHRVPLSERCIQILKSARGLGGDPFIFPGRAKDQSLSSMTFNMALRRVHIANDKKTYSEITTTHGMRSSFRDWAAERTHYPREVCEAALAHVNRNRVEAAYLRSDLFEQRRALMAQWAQHVLSPTKPADVVPFPHARKEA